MNQGSKPRSPRGLLVLVLTLVFIGCASLGVSFVNYKVGQSASQDQVEHNARLTVEVQRQGYETCKAIARVAVQVHLEPPVCADPTANEKENP